MSSTPESLPLQLLNDEPAANADHVEEMQRPKMFAALRTSAWDPYEVWRRCIKDPRDRRRSDKEPS